MTDSQTEPMRRLVVLRPGLELTRLGRIGPDADGSKYAESYRPPVNTIVEVPEIQAQHLVRNGACSWAELGAVA